MKNKLLIVLMLVFLFSITAVNAQENVTDNIGVDEAPNELTQEVDNSYVSLNTDNSNDNVLEAKNSKTNTTVSATSSGKYAQFNTVVKVKLAAKDTPLKNQDIKLNLNGVNYNEKTDSNGIASFTVKLNNGTYTAKYSYGGDSKYAPSSGSLKLTIKNPIKTTLKVGDKYINYRQGSKTLFYVKLLDDNKNPISGKDVTIKLNGKTYKYKTNSNGNAKMYVNLKKGIYTVKFSFAKSRPYSASSGSFKLNVKDPLGSGNGYWVFGRDMYNTNLDTLKNAGVKQIFLNFAAFSTHGKTAVVNWIKQANQKGMKVHIWMQVFYKDGKWLYPVTKSGELQTSVINDRVKEAVKYAKVSGVSGIHFDYVRFPGNAYQYKNADYGVNYFIKKATVEIHKVNPNLIVSAALMPEPSSNVYYYGQKISSMSKYLDAVIPMVYKGNYRAGTSWIKSTTSTLAKQSYGAKIWTGLQSYKSDDNPVKLSASELLKDAKAAFDGGATGVVLFRFGLSPNLNFNKI